MSRDILSEYDNNSMGDNRATNGGEMPVKDVRNYCPPQGPTGQSRQGPGLGGDNHGTNGTQGKH